MIATTDLAERLAQADAALWVDWMHAVRDLPGDPHGVDVATFDTVTALHVHGAPVPYYNRILGLTDGHGAMIDEMLGYYNERFTPCRVDVNPFYSGPSLLMALNDRGFHPSEFQTNLYMEPFEVEPVQVPGVQVREVRPKEATFFSRLYDRAYHGDRSPKRLARFRMDSIRARIGRPGWRFYLALVDGVPAGGGALFIKDGVGHLAGGATMFTLRGRGCQKALLNRRLLDAQAAGCEIVVSRCGVGSSSQRNMERAGLRTAYTKSIWQARSPV